MGEIEADLGANLRPERPTPKRILQRDDAPIDESADSAVSGAGRTEALEIGGIYAGICFGPSPVRRFVEPDRGGVGLLHRPSADRAAAGARSSRPSAIGSWSAYCGSGTTESSTFHPLASTRRPARRDAGRGRHDDDRPAGVPAAARNAKPAVPSLRAVEREVLEVIDDCGGEILLPNFIKATNGSTASPSTTGHWASRGSRCSSNASPASASNPGPRARSCRRANVAPPSRVRGQAATAGAGGGATGLARRRGDPGRDTDASPDAARKPAPSPPTIDSDYERRPAAARAAPPPAAVPTRADASPRLSRAAR